MEFNIPEMRDQWMQTSKLMDGLQSGKAYAQERFDNYKKQPLRYTFPSNFDGKLPDFSQNKNRPKAAILREKRSEEHTSELQSRPHLVCRLLLEKKKKIKKKTK